MVGLEGCGVKQFLAPCLVWFNIPMLTFPVMRFIGKRVPVCTSPSALPPFNTITCFHTSIFRMQFSQDQHRVNLGNKMTWSKVTKHFDTEPVLEKMLPTLKLSVFWFFKYTSNNVKFHKQKND